MRIVIIGGGPAGMLASISAAQNKDNQITLLEKNESLGNKLLITGKGRCNVTSSLPMNEFINNIPGNGKFLYSAFQNFTNQDIIELLKKNGVELKEERGHRYFPTTDKAQDVLDAFIKEMKRYPNIKIWTNSSVKKIIKKDNFEIELTNGNKIDADKLIIATGGKSASRTGSDGYGYELAKSLGHTITEIRPSLIPLTVEGKEQRICKELQGLSLKNVGIKFIDSGNKKVLYEDFGEMLFTHFGVSGPTILSGSAYLVRYVKKGDIKLLIDLKPALSEEKLDDRILRDFEANKNKEFKNSLNELLPQKLIPIVIELSEINEEKKVNSITKEERQKLVKLLKKFEITISGFRGIEDAVITAGGVNIKEINPKTMESKIVPGLYFAGEIIDVDAYTGGFNLQIAYSTGWTAGM